MARAGRQATADESGPSGPFLFGRTREKLRGLETAPVPPKDHDTQAPTEKATQAQLAEQTRIDDLKWLMGDARGRRFVWRLLQESGIYTTSYTGEALSMAFKEGQRNRGLVLLDEVTRHCPKHLSQMQTEARTNERKTQS